MKRFTAILFTGMMIFTLASCGKKAQDTPTEPATETQVATETQAAEKVEMPTETQAVTEAGNRSTANRNTADRSAAGRTDCRTAGRGAEQFR